LRLRSILNRAGVERDLDEEISYHIEQATSVYLARGFAPAAARAAALRQLGSVESTKETVRDTWHVGLWDQMRQDVRAAWRSLRHRPGGTAVVLLTLALGIGASTAVFSVINGVLLRPPYPDADRLFWLQERTPRGDLSAVSVPNYLDWQKTSRSFEIASWGFGPPVTLRTNGTAVPLRVTYVAPNYFDVLQVRPMLGRTFVRGDEQPGHDRVAILSHGLWSSRFHADPASIGRSIQLRGEPYEVVGVMPESASRGEWSYSEVWLPHTIDHVSANRAYRAFNTYARQRPCVTEAHGRAEPHPIAARLADAYPASNKGWTLALMRYGDVQVNSRMRQSLFVLLAAVGAVLLIACVNLANILLAKSLARTREAAIRAALGGGRRRLLAQFATESLLLSLAGGVLGLLTAELCLSAIRFGLPAFSSANAPLPPADAVGIDTTVLLFALAVSLATGVAFGLVPARAAASLDLAGIMRDRGATGKPSRLARRTLVVAEVALTFVLLIAAALMLGTFSRLQQVDLGFDDRNLLTATLPLDLGEASSTAAERRQYLQRILEGVRGVPGVQSAALTSILPMLGTGNELPCRSGGDETADPSERPNCFFKMVTPGYFSTLGLPFLAGRSLAESDRESARRIAVINQTLAGQYGGPQRAIGRRIVVPELVTTGRTHFGPEVAWQVVGVVADERVSPPNEERAVPGVYVSLDREPTRRPALVIRTRARPGGLERPLQLAVAGVNPDQPLADVRTFADIKAASLGSERQRSLLLAAFAGVSLLLAGVGIYGVLSYEIVQRTGEIGLRAAIGATGPQVMRLIIRDGLLLTLIGLAFGAAGAVAVWRLATGLVVGIGPLSLPGVLAAAVALLCVALLACLIPAQRATSIDPLTAMRSQ
jgi:putative ABC transport system permease protein